MPDENPWEAMWRVLSPTFNFPASGDIGSFSYHPNTLWEAPSWFRGQPETENSIYHEVASPGSQLGTLLDAVCLLLEQTPNPQGEGLKAETLRDDPVVQKALLLRDQINSHKARFNETRRQRLQLDLEQLKSDNPDAFARLMSDLNTP